MLSVVPEPAEAQGLPMDGRNFLDLALLIPGVSPTNVVAGTKLFVGASPHGVRSTHPWFPAQCRSAILLSAALQHHVWSDQPPGHRRSTVCRRHDLDGELRRPNGEPHSTQCGNRERLVHDEPAAEPYFQPGAGSSPGGIVGGVQSQQPHEQRHSHRHFGAGAYPASPAATFNQITAVADPRTFQFAVRMSS